MTRKEAQKLGLSCYHGDPCKHGHDGWRMKTGHCCTCVALARDNPALRDRAKRRAAAWYDQNKGQAAATQQRYRAAHPGYDRESKRRWKEANQPSVRAATAWRRAKRVAATPRWLSKEHRTAIRLLYKNCPEGSEVDHVIPLLGKNVCGLHVPWNLQHLSKEANRKKSNKVFQRLALAFSPCDPRVGSQSRLGDAEPRPATA